MNIKFLNGSAECVNVPVALCVNAGVVCAWMSVAWDNDGIACL